MVKKCMEVVGKRMSAGGKRMTREEAIKILKSKMDGHTDTSYEWAETVRMSIKALAQKPCEDAISRANLLEAYEDRFIELQKAHRADTQSGVNWCINTLKNMPPVVPTPKWISVSERLPDIHQDVLLSLRSLDIEVGFRAETEPYFYCHGDYIEPQNVLAWMPLPEPYKAESEEINGEHEF